MPSGQNVYRVLVVVLVLLYTTFSNLISTHATNLLGVGVTGNLLSPPAMNPPNKQNACITHSDMNTGVGVFVAFCSKKGFSNVKSRLLCKSSLDEILQVNSWIVFSNDEF